MSQILEFLRYFSPVETLPPNLQDCYQTRLAITRPEIHATPISSSAAESTGSPSISRAMMGRGQLIWNETVKHMDVNTCNLEFFSSSAWICKWMIMFNTISKIYGRTFRSLRFRDIIYLYFHKVIDEVSYKLVGWLFWA